ncbi:MULTISPECIES: NAD(P)H-binding protein [Planococcus]|uniref:Oxidoreductase n=1 Tax=Planococcus faecalis TaxID=1598147 RepID=A0ABM6IVH7_9BACL|nr:MULTISPECIES: NAD(P)H-binding protein [Planococcus]AQU80551.1 oxidoreductase [Planococcus faecalis]MDJ0330158.1 NAD(P)H-binding protein [Planococcus sp. S3-L1]OHX54045.1 oxidoreductase [Planococcus faecalis]
MNNKTALLAGASGLVGNELLHILLNSSHYSQVRILVRHPIELIHEKLEQIITDFNKLDDYADYFTVDDVYCCLGTTIKKAGSQEAFKKVDYDYPLKMAELAKSHQVKNFLVITALGADSNSKVFYSRTKGQLQLNLKKTGLTALHIFQPSLLLGERQEFRLGEKAATLLSPVISKVLKGKMKKYKPVEAKDVAVTMYEVAQIERTGNYTYPSDRIEIISAQSTEK